MTRTAAYWLTGSYFSGHTAIASQEPPISRENRREIHRPGAMKALHDALNASAYKLIKGGAKWVK